MPGHSSSLPLFAIFVLHYFDLLGSFLHDYQVNRGESCSTLLALRWRQLAFKPFRHTGPSRGFGRGRAPFNGLCANRRTPHIGLLDFREQTWAVLAHGCYLEQDRFVWHRSIGLADGAASTLAWIVRNIAW